MTVYLISIGAVVLAVAFAIYMYIRYSRAKLANASIEASKIIDEAKREAENYRKSAEIAAKEQWYQEKLKFEKETAHRRKEIEKAEKRQPLQSIYLQKILQSLHPLRP